MKLLLCTSAILLLFSCSREQKPENRVAASFHAEELPNNFKVDLSKRKVFPFSVVPGGTVTRDEVKSKVASDPVVREHYKGIQMDLLKPFRLTKPAQGYVSYRIGNRIFWTAQRLYLKSGEILLSDGLNLIRGRCGNRISLVANGPVQTVGEPTEAVLDLPSWDIPVFQAMAEEANRRDSDGPLFELRGNGPLPLLSLSGKIPETIFNVAPPVIGPGIIGGGLPGGLPPSGKGGEIIIINSNPLIFVASQPLTIPPPGILLPSIRPIEIARLDLPPSFIGAGPIGIGGPVFYFGELPLPPSIFVPPIYSSPTILISGGSPPLLYVPPTVVTPPGESNPPPAKPPTGPPAGPPAGGPEDPVNPPNTQPPPVFQPIPEPSTLGMVALAAALMFLLKRMPWQRPEPSRSWGGLPLR